MGTSGNITKSRGYYNQLKEKIAAAKEELTRVSEYLEDVRSKYLDVIVGHLGSEPIDRARLNDFEAHRMTLSQLLQKVEAEVKSIGSSLCDLIDQVTLPFPEVAEDRQFESQPIKHG
jgi:hypothetical protein